MKEFIESRYNLFLEDLQTLVNIDSGSSYTPGIKEIAIFFKKRFEAIGFKTTILLLGDEKIPCLKAWNKSEKTRSDIMFLGHMDTVFPYGEVKKRPFFIKDGKAYGPGVCDMKGGLLVSLHVLETLKEKGVLDDLSVLVAFNGDEETGSNSSRDWIFSNAKKSKRVFVFEPCRPGYRFVLKRKGYGWFRIIVHGQAAHAGAEPNKGINAVVELARQILAIDKLNSPGSGVSAQVTIIKGGNKLNIIPDKAIAEVDIRIANLEGEKKAESFFEILPEKPFLKNVKISVEGGICRPPMVPDQNVFNLWDIVRAKAKENNLEICHISTGGCSDGNFTTAAGVPTIDGMGLVGTNMHRKDEYIELESINNIILLIAKVCKHICEHRK